MQPRSLTAGHDKSKESGFFHKLFRLFPYNCPARENAASFKFDDCSPVTSAFSKM
jgi:hypothetical protein